MVVHESCITFIEHSQTQSPCDQMKILNYEAKLNSCCSEVNNDDNSKVSKQNLCKFCTKNVLAHQKAIMCDKCDYWFHTRCQKISDIEYENYQINYELKFECDFCQACVVCCKKIGKNHKKLLCTSCNGYIHRKCSKLSVKDFEEIVKDSFECIKCRADQLPLINLTDTQFYAFTKHNIFSDEIAHKLKPNDFQQSIMNKLMQLTISNEESDEHDEIEISETLDCEYYSIEDLKNEKISESKFFSILHYNIHSIQKHIDELRQALDCINFNFDILCFSESKIQVHHNPNIPINIPGYQTPVGIATESKKGGVLIYVKDGINFKPRPDLNIYSQRELESCFIEIVNKNHVNDVVGVVYRHPCMDESVFVNDHLATLTEKLNKARKNLYICGDFNYNLLNLETHSGTMEFFEHMLAACHVPVISKPTKIIEFQIH